jgi:hypothetical protein
VLHRKAIYPTTSKTKEPFYVEESMIEQLLCVMLAQQHTWVGATDAHGTLLHTQPC